MDVLGYTTLQKSYTSTFYYGFGYEQNVGEKISLGLTYRKGYSIDPDYSTLVNSYSFVGYENGVGYNVSFDILNISNWHEFVYTSKYFFEDNLDGGYFSTSIGLVKSEIEYDIQNIWLDQSPVYNSFDISYGVYKQDLTLVPISFDLGSRSEFDGWYYDFYLGLSILPFGNKKDVKPQFLHNRGVETMFDPVSFHIALCFGVSWAD